MAKYVKTEEGYTSKYDIGLATVEDMISIASATSTAQATADNAQATADLKMNADNPVGTGSFSMGRRAGSVIGKYSHAEGYDTIASAIYSHAEGHHTTASGSNSHAEGSYTAASGSSSHTEGANSKASRDCSHAEGYSTTASGDNSHAEGYSTTASGDNSHAEGYSTTASGDNSHAEGSYTRAYNKSQHIQGEWNIIDTTGSAVSRGTYAHIVGNGTGADARSNAHTLDWEGNAWFAGSVESTAIILKSTTSGSTKKFEITVDDAGTLSIKEV